MTYVVLYQTTQATLIDSGNKKNILCKKYTKYWIM